MDCKLMVLPHKNFEKIRVVRMPDDFEEQEAFRHATGLIASVEEDEPDCSWDDIAEALEDHGFLPVSYMLGPEQER